MRSDVTVFVCGDVMIGRGVDQILPHPSPPDLHEPYVQDARDYVGLAEQANGTIERPVDPRYIWGGALDELARVAPDVRVINLETSITRSDQYWPGKGIHYRMHPANIACLTAAGIDICALANNHVLDYGYGGLSETLQVLVAVGLEPAGAGSSLQEACKPAIAGLPDGRRVVLFSFAAETSGVPVAWAATAGRPGVDLLPDLSDTTADGILDRVRAVKRPGDVVIASVHWGSNWGYEMPASHVRFGRRLLEGDVDVLYGHSSHHPRPIEVYRNKLLLYGCGDFIDDYEGISGYEEFRDHLVLMYFARVDVPTGELIELRMTPMRICRMQVVGASRIDAEWLRDTLTLSSKKFGSEVELGADGRLLLRAPPRTAAVHARS